MNNRITFQSIVCLVMAVCIPITYAQDSGSTRIYKAANRVIGNDLDPAAIESELIESSKQEFNVLPQSTFKQTSTAIQQPAITTQEQNVYQPTTNGQLNVFKTTNDFTQNSSTNRQPNRPIQLLSPKVETFLPPQRHIGQREQISKRSTNSTFQQANDSNRIESASSPNKFDNNMYETKSTPTIQTQITAPRTTNINQETRFLIQANNIGQTDISSFKLIATLPNHARFIGSIPQPTSVNGNQYEFTFDSLTVRNKQTIQIDITPTEKIPMNIGTQIQIESQQQVAVTVQQPILEISVNGPDAIQTGKTFEHVVTVKNVGDGIAEAVRISTQRPTELEIGSQQQKTLVPKLVPGQTATFKLSSFATTAGNSNMIFQVSAKGAESRETKTPIRIIRPELGVQIFGPSQNYLGREGVYSIQLQNTSEMPITGVGVQLSIPRGLQIDTISQQAKIDKISGTLSWNFASIPGNQQQIIQFKAKATAVGNQVCQVNVKTNETASRKMSLQTEVLGRANLSIQVSDSGAPIGIGSKSEFSIEVANNGSQNADQVAIRVELPSALMPVNQPGYSIDPSGNYITFSNISVEAGKSQIFKFKVVAVTPGEHIVRGTVSLEGSRQTISSENSIFVFEAENVKVSDALVPEIRR